MEKFPRTYNLADFGVTANVTLQPSQWAKVGSVTVPAQQKVTFGSGSLGATDSRGQLYIRLCKEPGELNVEGKVRLVLANANETKLVTVVEERSERLRASENDRTQCVLLGEYPMKAQEDSKLIIQIYIDSSVAETFDYDNTSSKILIPVTVYQ